MSFERIHENDGPLQLDPLACLVYQMFFIFAYFHIYCDWYSQGECLPLKHFFKFYFLNFNKYPFKANRSWNK